MNGIQKLISHQNLTYLEALDLTFQNIAQNEVISTWMDSWDMVGDDPNISRYIEVPTEGCLRNEKRIVVKDSKEATIDRIWHIGGNQGYYVFE